MNLLLLLSPGGVKSKFSVPPRDQGITQYICIRFGHLKRQAIRLWVLVDAERAALAVARSKLSDPYVWGTGLLKTIGWIDTKK